MAQMDMKTSNAGTTPTVTIKPATKCSTQNGSQLKKRKNIRVAAYCRVSTGDESQQTSYTSQKAFYQKLITEKQGWFFAGIYADKAISGTSRIHRDEFNRMMNHAVQGKIDYIITKSISRFARNTVDTLNCVRQLKMLTPSVGIYFEKENVDTLDASSELLLTILSALAQDESRSISDNVRWSYAKKFQAGIAHVNLTRMLGYDKNPDGQWIVNEEQARTVRFIYDSYLKGQSACAIARELNQLGWRTAVGNHWNAGGIMDILRNEKYVGDCELQKTLVKDFLTHRSCKNEGEAPKYYIQNHHAPIIDRESWNHVQKMIANLSGTKRVPKDEKKTSVKGSPFSNLRCGERIGENLCGEKLCRDSYSLDAHGYTDSRSLEAEGITEGYRERYKYTFPVWRCRGRYGEKHGNRIIHTGNECCTAAVIYEKALEQSFMEMLYCLKRDYEMYGMESTLPLLFEKAYYGLKKEKDESSGRLQRIKSLQEQIAGLEEDQRKLQFQQLKTNHDEDGQSRTSTLGHPDWTIYTSLARDIRQQVEELNEKLEILLEEPEDLRMMRKNYERFLRCLEALPSENTAGIRISINDADNGVTDMIPFDRGLYVAFIKNGIVHRDTVEYQTSFGVKLVSTGNSRTLKSFLGYRHCEGSLVKYYRNVWEVSGSHLQYRRTKTKKKK